MKSAWIAALLFVVLDAHSASSSGIGLRWGDCDGPSNRDFSCMVNTSADVLVGFFDPPSGVYQLTGNEMTLHFDVADGALPPWWQLRNSGSCRASSLVASWDFTGSQACTDYWNGQSIGGVGTYRVGENGPGSARLLMACAVAPDNAGPVNVGTRYASFKLVIGHQRTTGSDACAGCTTPMCITLDSITLTEPKPVNTAGPARKHVLTDPLIAGSGPGNIASWQGGGRCAGSSKQQVSSWGKLKTIFR